MHLESPADARFERFSECLLVEREWADEIYLLGDVVEMWIGDDDDSACAEALAQVLKQAAAEASVNLLHGNRDFLIGETFAEQNEVTLRPDPFLLEDGLLLSHGDLFCTDDEAYQNMRALFRSSAWQQDILSKSLAERQALGTMLRNQSKTENANKASNIMDVNEDAVRTELQNQGATRLIHGHTHRPGHHNHGDFHRWVLGAWEHCGWLLRQQDATLQLECFSLARRYGT